jgi:hypothetical protein
LSSRIPNGHWKPEEPAIRQAALAAGVCAVCGDDLSKTTNDGDPFCYLRPGYPDYYAKYRGWEACFIYSDTHKKVVWIKVLRAHLSDHQIVGEWVPERDGVETTTCASVYEELYFSSWRVTKSIVRARDGYRCRSCRADFSLGWKDRRGRPEFDHIVPISQGGEPLDPANVQMLCGACHYAKTVGERVDFVYRPTPISPLSPPVP